MSQSLAPSHIAALAALTAALLSFVNGARLRLEHIDRVLLDRAAAPCADAALGTGPAVWILELPDATSAEAWSQILAALAARRPAGVLIDHDPAITEDAMRHARALEIALGMRASAAAPDATTGDARSDAVPEQALVPLYGAAPEMPVVARIRSPARAQLAAAAALGVAHLIVDGDGRVRRVPLVQRALVPERAIAGVALAVLMAAYGDRILQLGRGGRLLLGFCGTDVPLDADGALALRFRGEPGTFPLLPPPDAHGGPNLRDAWPIARGDFVVIGREHDVVDVPTGRAMTHAEVFATAIDNLVRGDPMREAPAGLLLLLAACAGALGALPLRDHGCARAVLACVLVAVTALAAVFLCARCGLLVPATAVALPAVAGVALAWLAARVYATP